MAERNAGGISPGRATSGDPIFWSTYDRPLIENKVLIGTEKDVFGTVRRKYEKRSHLVSFVLLDLNGNYSPFAVANARGQRAPTLQGMARLQDRLRKSFMYYHRCPVVDGTCPEFFKSINNPDRLPDGAKCEGYGTREKPRAPLDSNNTPIPCAHMQAIRDHRLKLNREQWERDQKLSATTEGLLQQAVKELLEERAKGAPAMRGGKRKGEDE